MKTPKPIVVKSVSGAVAASILVSSCLPGYDFDDSYYGPHADNLTHGESFFELSESNLSEEFFHKLKAIQQIVETVLIDKKEARQFANNPTEYVASKEIHLSMAIMLPSKNFSSTQAVSMLNSQEINLSIRNLHFTGC